MGGDGSPADTSGRIISRSERRNTGANESKVVVETHQDYFTDADGRHRTVGPLHTTLPVIFLLTVDGGSHYI